MFRKTGYLLTVLCLSSCTHDDESLQQNVKKTDLSKAASYNVQLGLGYLKQNDVPRAKKKLLLALTQEPNSANANSAMAYYFEKTNDNEQAKKYYLKALTMASEKGAQQNNYGAFLCRAGEFDKAEIYFLKAATDIRYVNTAAAYENAALCALSASQPTKAKIYFTKSLNQDPERVVSFYELLKLEKNEEHFDAALNLLKAHPDLVYNDKTLLALAKEITEKAGRFDLAAAYKNNLNKIESNPDNSGVNNEYSKHA